MKNYVQPGDVITVPAPATVTAGAGVLVGSLFGIAVTDAASGAPVNICVNGVVDAVKATGQAWTVGQLVYWSGTNVTNVASTNKLIGCAVQAQASGDTVGRVRLNGAAITA
jgi:predicted RecA/RadA family phage recombinase